MDLAASRLPEPFNDQAVLQPPVLAKDRRPTKIPDHVMNQLVLEDQAVLQQPDRVNEEGLTPTKLPDLCDNQAALQPPVLANKDRNPVKIQNHAQNLFELDYQTVLQPPDFVNGEGQTLTRLPGLCDDQAVLQPPALAAKDRISSHVPDHVKNQFELDDQAVLQLPDRVREEGQTFARLPELCDDQATLQPPVLAVEDLGPFTIPAHVMDQLELGSQTALQPPHRAGVKDMGTPRLPDRLGDALQSPYFDQTAVQRELASIDRAIKNNLRDGERIDKKLKQPRGLTSEHVASLQRDRASCWKAVGVLRTRAEVLERGYQAT